MHDNRSMLFFIETDKFYTAENDTNLYKVPITWISLYSLINNKKLGKIHV